MISVGLIRKLVFFMVFLFVCFFFFF
ncbi:unnamed protein product [Spirodela intermedia]|uniref:Uncharacterized protein n=1 Tax=Spirodela intermedia TaxID=51605 RepID=A0A7I8KM45_SPIIN|nr:unnamed protein product [Spirodela intermedia]